MINWIVDYVKDLVQYPDQVSVTQKEGVSTIVFNLKMASDDLPLFDSRLSKALESVVSLAGSQIRRRYILKVSA